MVSLYASVGASLTHYHLDVDAGTLTRQATISLPQDIQYCWPHVSKKYLYVTSSNTLPKGPVGTEHHLTALKIDPLNGTLSPHGEAIRLPTRPVHVATDIPSTHALVAFTIPSALRIYTIKPDGTLGGEVAQSGPVDAGIFAHQVRVTLDNRLAVLVTRGNDAADGKPEDPGALKVFKYRDGQLGDCASIAPNNGYGFGARHLDFHPTQPWIYVSIERQNQMMMFKREGDVISSGPVFTRELMAEPGNVRSKQLGGTVHVHPKGHVVYGINRAYTPVEVNGRKILPGGENNIVVFKIDQATGEPTAIQHIDTRGVYCRTFHIDPSGRLLVAANIISLDVQDGAGVKTVPASLALFRIADDGRLEYLRKYDMDVGAKTMFWMGMV